MKVPEKYYDEVFEFNGQWDVPSKCGLKIRTCNGTAYLIVTELYQDNPGTSVTYAGYSLLKQICESKGFSEKDVIYLECNPDTNSKLSFYDEEVFQVSFPEISGTDSPDYRQLSPDEIKSLFPDPDKCT
ncbi:MAG: hypothetical protein LBG28_06190 [Tannerella sp.]|jgi:hypothetical protein|nr:hypothetical protein [Tannerella sp.]